MRCRRALPRRMTLRYVRPAVLSACSSSPSSSRKPEIEVSGVRSSCETAATNASRSRSRRRSAVTSRSVQIRPTTVPSCRATGAV